MRRFPSTAVRHELRLSDTGIGWTTPVLNKRTNSPFFCLSHMYHRSSRETSTSLGRRPSCQALHGCVFCRPCGLVLDFEGQPSPSTFHAFQAAEFTAHRMCRSPPVPMGRTRPKRRAEAPKRPRHRSGRWWPSTPANCPRGGAVQEGPGTGTGGSNV